MKRVCVCVLAALIMLALVLPLGALADTRNMVVTADDGAVMYDSCYIQLRKPLALVPKGGVVLVLDAIDWGYLVGFGNYLGYIEFWQLTTPAAKWQMFALPTGQDYSIDPGHSQGGWDVPAKPSVPEFDYTPLYCVANQKLYTRSGPNTKYTSPGSFPASVDLTVYYQAPGNGVQWAYLELWHGGVKYRVYTGMKRIDAYYAVPNLSETYTQATISEGHRPYYGPGDEYALAEGVVPGGVQVQALFTENGWLLYEYTLANGMVQRAWAPPTYWY